MPKNPLFIASDHAGFALKAAIQKLLPGYDWQDIGPIDGKNSVDYPDMAAEVGKKIQAYGPGARGILICGSGIGMSISANKIAGIRAALVENPVSARLAREHNDSNVLCLGSRFVAPEYGAEIAKIWLETPFSEEPRHQGRIQKMSALEKS